MENENDKIFACQLALTQVFPYPKIDAETWVRDSDLFYVKCAKKNLSFLSTQNTYMF